MPNWCQNEIKIHGDENEIKKLKDFVKSSDSEFDFNNIKPMPKELEGTVSGSENSKPDWQKEKSKELIRKYGYDNWYDWKNANWDTKWEASEVEVEYEDEYGDFIQYNFDTAWGPPLAIFKELNKFFNFNSEENNLSIQWFYREDGMGFCGYLDQDISISN